MYGKYKRRKTYGRRRRSASRFKFARRFKAGYGRRRYRFRRNRRVRRTIGRRTYRRSYRYSKRRQRRDGVAHLTSHLQFDDITLDIGTTDPFYHFDISTFELTDLVGVDTILANALGFFESFRCKKCMLVFETQYSKVPRRLRTWTEDVSGQINNTSAAEDPPLQLANLVFFTLNDTKYLNNYIRNLTDLTFQQILNYQQLLKNRAAKKTPINKIHKRSFVPRIFGPFANVPSDTYTKNIYPKGAARMNWLPTRNYTDYTNFTIRGMSWGLLSKLKNADLPTNLNAPKVIVTPHLYSFWDFKGLKSPTT